MHICLFAASNCSSWLWTAESARSECAMWRFCLCIRKNMEVTWLCGNVLKQLCLKSQFGHTHGDGYRKHKKKNWFRDCGLLLIWCANFIRCSKSTKHFNLWKKHEKNLHWLLVLELHALFALSLNAGLLFLNLHISKYTNCNYAYYLIF